MLSTSVLAPSTMLADAYATALMGFLAALALAAALSVGDAATRWSAGFGGGLTIQLGAPPAKTADPLPRIVEMLLATPGVATVSETPEEDINRLLAPWLGGLVDLHGVLEPVVVVVPQHNLVLPALLTVHFYLGSRAGHSLPQLLLNLLHQFLNLQKAFFQRIRNLWQILEFL